MKVAWPGLTLRVAAGLYEPVWPLAGSSERTEGQAGIAGNPVGRKEGADPGPGPGRDHGGQQLQSLGLDRPGLLVWT